MDVEQENSLLKQQLTNMQGQIKHLANAFIDHEKKTREVIRGLKASISSPSDIQSIVNECNKVERKAYQDLRDDCILKLNELREIL